MNAHYAVPGEDLGTKTVRERYYLGPCRANQIHEVTIKELGQFEDKIEQYIQEFEFLDNDEKADMIGYLDSYFKDSREPGFIDREITPTCR